MIKEIIFHDNGRRNGDGRSSLYAFDFTGNTLNARRSDCIADEHALFLQSSFRQLTAAISDNFKNYALAKLKLEFFQFNCVFLPAVFLHHLCLRDVFPHGAVEGFDAFPHANIYVRRIERVSDAERVEFGIGGAGINFCEYLTIQSRISADCHLLPASLKLLFHPGFYQPMHEDNDHCHLRYAYCDDILVFKMVKENLLIATVSSESGLVATRQRSFCTVSSLISVVNGFDTFQLTDVLGRKHELSGALNKKSLYQEYGRNAGSLLGAEATYTQA